MMADVLSRSSQFEAINGSIAEGQMPGSYTIVWNPHDEVFTVTADAGPPIEFTTSSFVALVREANLISGGKTVWNRLSHAIAP